jgi:hypothetical protein
MLLRNVHFVNFFRPLTTELIRKTNFRRNAKEVLSLVAVLRQRRDGPRQVQDLQQGVQDQPLEHLSDVATLQE